MFRYQVLTLGILLIVGSGEGLWWGGSEGAREADGNPGGKRGGERSRMGRHGRNGS